MPEPQNTRALEEGLVSDFTDKLSYGEYLDLDDLLAAQRPVS